MVQAPGEGVMSCDELWEQSLITGVSPPDQRGPGVAAAAPGEQPLPHRGERARPEERPQVQRAHHPLREEGPAPER